ncbi:MAG TPA: ATP synthase F1 subunit delta [Bacteroidia bacterium]|nr:ATP synthase F1 subunit delta [Bacteroidia bacterium]
MKGLKLATRYAKSLIDLAAEQKMLERVFDDMKLVNDSCKASRELIVALQSPIIKTDKKQAILKSLFADKVSDVTMRFLNIIAEKKREMFIPEIANSFVSQYKEIKQIKTAEIITAAPLDEKLRANVLDIIKNYTHTEVELHEKVDTDIIGGYILTIEGEQDDTSIKTKINKLKRAFQENLYIKDF